MHTDNGTIPLSTKTDLSRQKKVTVAIRPKSFEKDDAGAIRGVITRVIYTGASLDTWIEAAGKNGKPHHIITQIHPEEHVKIGDHVRFSVLPHFVSIIAQNE